MKNFTSCLVLVATVTVALWAVPSALADKPTRAELRALQIRGWLLNDRCGISTQGGAAYRTLCRNEAVGDRVTLSELRALEIRGQAMNNLCENLSGEGYAAVCGGGQSVAAPRTARPRPARVEWAVVGMGAGSMIGLVLLTGGIVAGVRYGHARGNVRLRPAR